MATHKINEDEPLNILNEPAAMFDSLRVNSITELNYAAFKKLADTIDFTTADWATIMHVSERTLQRYAKKNTRFAPINAERFQQIKKVIEKGKAVFGSTNNFYNWISRNPYMLEEQLSIKSLSTYDGIQNVLTQLGRIEQGIFA